MRLQHQSRYSTLWLIIFVFGILLTGQIFSIQAQTTKTAPTRGVSPNKSYSVSDIETIGNFSGNLMFNVPLGSLPAGRSGMSAGINLHYDSKLWDILVTDVVRFTTTHDMKTLIKSDEGGWQYGYKYRLKLEYLKLSVDQGYCTSGNAASFYPYKLQLVTPDGGKHELVLGHSANINEDGFMSIFPDGRAACPESSNPTITSGDITYFTTDETFMRLDLTTDNDTDWENNTWTLYAPDGTRVTHNPASGISQRIKDRNDNYIDVIENAADANYSNRKTTYLQDQMGRKVIIEYNVATDEDWIRSKGIDGATVITKVKWKNIAVNKYYFACEMAPSPLDQNAYENFELNESFRVVDKVYLPLQLGNPSTDDFFYTFEYNVNETTATDVGWGEVSKVTQPSGAFTTYSYYFNNVSGSGIDAESVLLNRPTQKQITYNREYNETSESVTETWSYTPIATYNVLSNLNGLTITAPDGGITTESYAERDTINVVPPSIPEQVRGETYKSEAADGTVIERFYTSNVPTYPNLLNKANRYVKYEFVSIRDGNLTSGNNYKGDLVKTAIKEYSYDKNGNMTEIKEYDFVAYSAVPRNGGGRPNGLPSGATPARITKTEYYNDTPDAASTTFTDTESYHLATSPRIRNAVKSSEVQDATQTPKSRSEVTYDNASTTGNPTQTRTWDSTKGSYSNPLTTNSVSTSVSYDSYGNPTLSTDSNNNQTQVTYGSINGYSGLYPTQIISAYGTSIARTSTATYDFHTGLMKTTTDVDNNVTNGTEYDELSRPIKVKAAIGTPLEIWTTTEYDDINRRVVVKSDLETKGDGKKVATQFLDQLGRVRLSKTLENAAMQSATNETDGIKVQTRYLTSNPYSYQLTSNPYRANYSYNAGGEETMGWTRTKSINTGKQSEVETFSGANLPAPWGSNSSSAGKVQTNNDADRTLFTDQAGKQRISRTNALGQLKDVWEITTQDSWTSSVSFPAQSGIAYGYQTSYDYDLLNNLMQINQGSQTRTFSYSSLSRLLSANNPEAGTISYIYDNNGNLTQKTDARSISTSYSYDALNRVTTRNYSDITPNVTYTYDATSVANSKGKLTKVDNGFSKTEYTEFDILGRVKKSKQTTDGTAYNEMEYTYNLSGALIEQKYPSGRLVKNILDASGDLSIVQSKKNSNYGFWNYAKHFTFTAAGAVSSMQLGNGRWESATFNSRLQPTQIALGVTQSATNLLDLDFSYGTTANNGNVLSQTITVPTVGSYAGFTATQNYNYDSLNRIKDANETISGTQTWKQTFTYDRYGNRSFDESGSSGNYLTTTLNRNCSTSSYNPNGICDKKKVNPTFASTNRIAQNQDGTNDYLFDSAGNTTKDASGNTFIYDADNKQIEVKNSQNQTIGQYWYDGDGKRVKKYVPSSGEITLFVYDASGKMVAEYSTIVASQSEAQVSYLTNDRLGSLRIITDENGQVTSRRDFMPFGEEVSSSQRNTNLNYSSDNIRQKFTGYERDAEVNLDFAQARYHNYNLGRFNSPDPVLIKEKRLADPQAINLYVYVRNNPLNYTDPDGREYVDEEGNQITVDVVDGWVLVNCAKCKKDSKQLADVRKLAHMINSTRSTVAMEQFMALHKSKTKIHLEIDTTTNTGDRYGVHKPHGSKNGATNVPLDWDRSAGFFEGNPDIIGDKKGQQYYREATIILYQAEYDPDGTMNTLELFANMLGTFVHESEHDLDPNQIWNAYNGVRGSPSYHPTSLYNKENRALDEIRRGGLDRMEWWLRFEYLYYNGYYKNGCYVPDF